MIYHFLLIITTCRSSFGLVSLDRQFIPSQPLSINEQGIEDGFIIGQGKKNGRKIEPKVGFIPTYGFGIPSRFRGIFGTAPEFRGPFGGDVASFGGFLGTLNQKVFLNDDVESSFNEARIPHKRNVYAKATLKRHTYGSQEDDDWLSGYPGINKNVSEFDHQKVINFERPQPVYVQKPKLQIDEENEEIDSKEAVVPSTTSHKIQLNKQYVHPEPLQTFDITRLITAVTKNNPEKREENTLISYREPINNKPASSPLKISPRETFRTLKQTRTEHFERPQSSNNYKESVSNEPQSTESHKTRHEDAFKALTLKQVPQTLNNYRKPISNVPPPSPKQISQHEDKFRPLTVKKPPFQPTKINEASQTIFDDSQLIITAPPSYLRRHRKKQVFDVKVGASFGTNRRKDTRRTYARNIMNFTPGVQTPDEVYTLGFMDKRIF